VCRALATEVGFLSVQGGRSARRAERLGREVMLQAERLGDPYLLAGAHLARGLGAFFGGRYRAALEPLVDAERYFATEVVGAWWERSTARYFLSLAQVNMGELPAMVQAVQRTVAEAARRNDVYSRSLFLCYPMVWCAIRDDAPDRAEAGLEDVLVGWPVEAHYQAHYMVRMSRVMLLLYRGEGAETCRLIDEGAPTFRALMLRRMPLVWGEIEKYRGTAALRCGDAATAARAAARLSRSRLAVAHGFAAAIRGQLQAAGGDREAAQRSLARAVEVFEEVGDLINRTAWRHRLGELLGGERGEVMMAESARWMRQQGVTAPDRLLDFLAPQLEA
jgi:tetratricopeptide (TPR) repeat protein